MRPISDASITGFSAAAVASLFEGWIGLTRVDSGVIHVANILMLARVLIAKKRKPEMRSKTHLVGFPIRQV